MANDDDDTRVAHFGTMPGSENVADLTLEHLRALRREMKAMFEWRGDVLQLLAGIVTRIDRLDDDVKGLRSEIAALDIKDITRQDEILTIFAQAGARR